MELTPREKDKLMLYLAIVKSHDHRKTPRFPALVRSIAIVWKA